MKRSRTKTCSKCNTKRPLKEFSPAGKKSGKDGRHSACKHCQNQSMKGALRVNGGMNKSRAYRMLKNAEHRARKFNIPFSIKIEWIWKRFESGVCEATGLPLDFTMLTDQRGKQQTNIKAFAPTLDRKDPTKGYTQSNAQLVCWIYNRAKGRDKHDAVRRLAKAVLSYDQKSDNCQSTQKGKREKAEGNPRDTKRKAGCKEGSCAKRNNRRCCS